MLKSAVSFILPEFDVLPGEQVLLKPFRARDISPEYVDWLNDTLVVKYSNQRFTNHSLESCKAYLATFDGTLNRFIKIVQKDDGRFVGTMTVYVSTPHQTVDVGILIGCPSVWGKGVGQDSWNTLLRWLLEQPSVRKITAGAMRCNKAMVKIMERSGMILEAVRPQQELLDGVPQDLMYYGIFRGD
jgi:[ribosomal protein S5]-alanine N-acetyltransferase